MLRWTWISCKDSIVEALEIIEELGEISGGMTDLQISSRKEEKTEDPEIVEDLIAGIAEALLMGTQSVQPVSAKRVEGEDMMHGAGSAQIFD